MARNEAIPAHVIQDTFGYFRDGFVPRHDDILFYKFFANLSSISCGTL